MESYCRKHELYMEDGDCPVCALGEPSKEDVTTCPFCGNAERINIDKQKAIYELEQNTGEDLLPCPFCGGNAKRNDDLQNWGDIFCADCGCHMAEGSMVNAIKAWNTRNTKQDK